MPQVREAEYYYTGESNIFYHIARLKMSYKSNYVSTL